MADLLIATFPAKKSILAAGTHVGMAATSVLEPVVLLYRFTGEPRYLEFARYIVKSWDEPGGPGILATPACREGRQPDGQRQGLRDAVEPGRRCASWRGPPAGASLLEPVEAAWKDIVANRLYLTGSASAGEHFQDDHVLPGQVGAHIGETCVTTTWIQLNLQLLRLTGECEYGDELERSFYNHLAAAQHPRGDDWCYYTALEGKKPYDPGINCCHSSGPRGMALAVQAAYLRDNSDLGHDLLIVNTLETSRAELRAGWGQGRGNSGEQVSPRGESTITLHMAEAGEVRTDRQGPEVGEDAAAGERLQAHRQRRAECLDGHAWLRRRPPPGVEGRRPRQAVVQARRPRGPRAFRRHGPGRPDLGAVRAGLRRGR